MSDHRMPRRGKRLMQTADKLSFAKDIRPIFTAMDVDHMTRLGMNLGDRDTVLQNAAAIYAAVSSGSMPPPASGEPRWTPEMCERFKTWWDQGGLP